MICLALQCFWSAQAIHAATASLPISGVAETGWPLLRNFSPAEYGAAVQNWSIAQDRRGIMYFGSSEDGVLEYDGVRWRKIPVPNRTPVRSLALGADGRIYVGTIGDIGYLEPDATGAMHYVSLLERLEPEDRAFSDVWRTFATPEGIYFSSFQRLIRIDGQRIKVWRAASSFHIAFRVRNQIYIREVGRGLLQLVDDRLQKVLRGEHFANDKIFVMQPWPLGSDAGTAILVGTRSQGWFILDGQHMQRWRTEIDDELADALLYGGVRLADGNLAVGTLRAGVLLLDTEGRLVGRLDKSTGLIDQTIFDLFQDREGNLWMATDHGIVRARVGSPITYFGEGSGLDGSVISMHRHDGTLYAGTTQGLFRLATRSRGPARFVAVPGITGQVWAFLTRGKTLLVAGYRGVYEIRGSQLRLVRPADWMSYSLLQSRQNPERVFIGLHNGVASMRAEGRHWVDEGVLPSLSDEVRTMMETADGHLWIGSFTTGVVKLPLTPDGRLDADSASKAHRFGPEQGLPPGLNFVYPLHGAPVFGTTAGIYKFAAANARFVVDPRFEHLFDEGPRQAYPIVADAAGRVWIHSVSGAEQHKELGAAVPDEHGVYRWASEAMSEISGTNVAAIMPSDDGVIWFGSDDDVYRYDPRRATEHHLPAEALVRNVTRRDGTVIFGGAGTHGAQPLPYAQNALRFDFAIPSFGTRPNQFQVYLEGVDSDWTAWSPETYRDYTNLHEGSYRFRVRAMNPAGQLSEEGMHDFSVLPPWYRTRLAYLGYLMVLLALLAGISRWRSTALNSRNRELMQLVALRTAELSQANQALHRANESLSDLSLTDALTGLRNRRNLVEHIDEDIAAMRAACASAAGPPASYLHFLMIDIDHFKQINDNHGHAAGDRVLEQFGEILRKLCRDEDTAVRWGGEEFMLMTRSTDGASGAGIAERIRSQVAAHAFQIGAGKTLRRTCSIGFAGYTIAGDAAAQCSWEVAVRLADQCLYEAKRGGRNGWVGVRPTDRPAASAEELGDLAMAIENGHLELMKMPGPAGRQAVA